MERPEWQAARTILLYHALPDEVDTSRLLDCYEREKRSLLHDEEKRPPLSDEKKRILLPVIVGDELELREYTGTTHVGAFNIQEPIGSAFTDYEAIDLVLVPGLAFDPQGHRLGRGRGYYDRLLPRLPRAFRLGLCFPFQLLPSVPTDPHDIPMHAVIA